MEDDTVESQYDVEPQYDEPDSYWVSVYEDEAFYGG
jgi:hypothetical protein